jgi:hypothetical protein
MGNRIVKLEIDGYVFDINNINKEELFNNIVTAKEYDGNDIGLNSTCDIKIGSVIIGINYSHVFYIFVDVDKSDNENVYFIYDNGVKVKIVDKNDLILLLGDEYIEDKELINEKDLNDPNVDVCKEINVYTSSGRDCDNLVYCIVKREDDVKIEYYVIDKG